MNCKDSRFSIVSVGFNLTLNLVADAKIGEAKAVIAFVESHEEFFFQLFHLPTGHILYKVHHQRQSHGLEALVEL